MRQHGVQSIHFDVLRVPTEAGAGITAMQPQDSHGRRTVATAAAVRTRPRDAREDFDQSGAGVNDEVGAGLSTSQDGTDLNGAQDIANPEFGLFRAEGDAVHHLDDLTPVARQDVDVEILQQLNDFGGRHQVPSGQTRSSGILHDFQLLPIQIAPYMRRQDPVSMLDQPDVPKELAKPGSLTAILKCVGCKEQRFRLAATASDAGIGIAPIVLEEQGLRAQVSLHGVQFCMLLDLADGLVVGRICVKFDVPAMAQ
ncbi:hypothetical protein PG990_014386 [Apiospora arundinis]